MIVAMNAFHLPTGSILSCCRFDGMDNDRNRAWKDFCNGLSRRNA